jgi:DNA-binding SARP family transcriptional activator
MLTIELLGPLTVRHAGEAAALPPSRKTRLLLGYLAATGRPQRRERLCEMFWDAPDDPRGALRWSLSKLRAALDRPDAPVVVADRDTVALALRPEQVDYLAIRETLRDGVDAAATADLEAVAARFRGPFLADLDPPQNPELQSWLAGAREEMRRLHAAILTALADRYATQAERALPYARELVQLDPFAESSWARLIERLATLGRRREVEEQGGWRSF